MSEIILGVDTGGTFTDLMLVDKLTGKLKFYKLPSTNHDPSIAAVNGIEELLGISNQNAGNIKSFRHGTTVATNAVLEGKSAKTALITTQGFKDILELARQRRPHLYNLDIEKPNPIAQRNLRFEIEERLNAKGEIVSSLDITVIQNILNELKKEDVESIAVCFLHSYANGEHENEIKSYLLNEYKDNIYVCTSNEVINEFREYERFSSTVINASLQPIMDRYLDNLERETMKVGLTVSPQVMKSSGGVMSTNTARKFPINTFLSGPVAGVIGAVHCSSKIGEENFITFDMGGTSTDVSLVANNNPSIRREQNIAGLPVMIPTVDIHTVGAGGGSIAWIDEGGLMKVGPKSAGAFPGPACYKRGGKQPTVTDANLLLGRINPNSLLGGRMDVDGNLTEQAIANEITTKTGMGSLETAKGIIEIVTQNIVQAIRLVSVEQGFDPREFSLMAFGGAGPLHAADVAQELGISKIIIPSTPGLMCAKGLLHSNVRADFSQTYLMQLKQGTEANLIDLKHEITNQFLEWYHLEEFQNEQFHQNWTIDLRYKGQDFELTIQLPDLNSNESVMEKILEQFHESHERYFGYAYNNHSVEMVAIRLEVMSDVASIPESKHIKSDGQALLGTRKVWFKAFDFIDTPIYLKEYLTAEQTIKGPAIIEQMDSTTVIPPNMNGFLNETGDLILTWRN